MLSNQAKTYWAKSWPMGTPEIESWLPLWQHLEDSALLAYRLWDEWLPDSVKKVITKGCGSPESSRTLLAFLAGVHDIGKATPAFAVQVGILRDEMAREGLHLPKEIASSERSQRPHGLAGQAILMRWLRGVAYHADKN
ncbi:MAG: hypothetical protein LBR21_03630 [Propionibacteriaceae bacterium]|jgi:CRISPR-associated endonuclease/helicase Cas3|nr:hypothetical protein [Propionibacteriaceae bacterium]